MATRKSGDDVPSAPGSKAGEQRPGSYAQISGSRRKRKKGRGRPSSASGDANAQDDGSASDDGREHRSQDGSEHRSQHGSASGAGERSDGAEQRAESDAGSVPVDDLRVGRQAPARAARRTVGPLGMSEQAGGGVPGEPSGGKTKSSSQPRMNVVEINPAELARGASAAAIAVEPARRESEATAEPDERAELSSGVRASDREKQALHERQEPHETQAEHDRHAQLAYQQHAARDGRAQHEQHSEQGWQEPTEHDRDPHPDERYAHEHERSSSTQVVASRHALIVDAPRHSWGVDELAFSDPAGADEGSEFERPSLSSVFDARPSLRPSPAPPPDKGSPALWLVVTLLCSIIAAAGVVALREAIDEEPAPRTPRTATSARPPADEVASTPAPPVQVSAQPAAEPLPELGASAQPVNEADAGAARPIVRRAPVRLPRAAVAAPTAASTSAGSAASSESLPENPYADP